MQLRAGPIGVSLAVVLATTSILATARLAGQGRATFRAHITLVPVDVRVLGRDGKPIADLTQNDFTLLENGVPQKITHFSMQAFEAEPAGPSSPSSPPALRKVPALDLAPQKQRIFLIVLGRGRLNEPSKGPEAAMKFVRERLLPQDQVAVMAWNRATDFTMDHEAIARVLDRFKQQHEKIESRLDNVLRGLTAIYGSKAIPASLQAEIDAVFRGPGAPTSRQLPPAGGTGVLDRMTEDTRRTTEAMQRVQSVGADNPLGTLFDQLQSDATTDLSFEDYVSRNAETFQDYANIQSGIEYMRYLEGEKHLVFLTRRGLYLSLDGDNALAAVANDARVVIDTIHVGGMPGIPPDALLRAGPPPLPGPSFNDTFAIMSIKNVSQLTGGLSSTYGYADAALARIDGATRVDYLLGYYPADNVVDGRYRRIVVRVNRPGATVLFRHGYNASDVVVPTDRRAFLVNRRVAAAGAFPDSIRDLAMQVKVSVTHDEQKIAREALIDVVVQLDRVVFKTIDDRHVAHLDVTVFCADAHERLVGQLWQAMDLKLKDETYERMKKEGVPYQAKIALRGEPKWVKVIVYDYDADLVGSLIVTVK